MAKEAYKKGLCLRGPFNATRPTEAFAEYIL